MEVWSFKVGVGVVEFGRVYGGKNECVHEACKMCTKVHRTRHAGVVFL